MYYENKKTEALEELKQCDRYDIEPAKTILKIFPELEESDYVIKQRLIHLLGYFRSRGIDYNLCDRILNWLEKQGETNETINKDKFAQDVLRGAAINLITWIDYNAAEGNMCLSNMECMDIEDALVSGNWDKIYAYIKKKLERQGEQNPTDKIEPKFKVGDWVVFNNDHNSIYQIEKIENYEYTLRHILGGSMSLSFSHGNMIRAWTIEDAKDGDVLKEDSCIFIVEKMNPNETAIVHCCLFDDGEFDLTGSTLKFEVDSTKPATKEQRELLFSKMKEAGYEWDTEKKELKKIEKIDEKYKVGKYFTGLIPCWVNAPSTLQPAHNYHGKNIVAIHLKDGGYRCCCIDDKKPVTFSLPENTPLIEGWKRKSVEWSDDDEKTMQHIFKCINASDYIDFQKIKIWLESLKNRVQPHWKPTDEQMSCFKQAIDLFKMKVNDDLVLRNLNSLYDDLKKL